MRFNSRELLAGAGPPVPAGSRGGLRLTRGLDSLRSGVMDRWVLKSALQKTADGSDERPERQLTCLCSAERACCA